MRAAVTRIDALHEGFFKCQNIQFGSDWNLIWLSDFRYEKEESFPSSYRSDWIPKSCVVIRWAGRKQTQTHKISPCPLSFSFILFCFFSWNKGKTPERTAWRISKYWCPATRSVGIRSTPRCQPLLIHPLHPFFRTGLLQLPTAQGNWFSPFVPKDRGRHTVFAGSRYDGVGGEYAPEHSVDNP